MEVYLKTEQSLGPNPTFTNAWQGFVVVGELIRKGMGSKAYNGNDIFFLERSLVIRFSLNQAHVEGDKFGRLL